MNRIEELELTVQMLIDGIDKTGTYEYQCDEEVSTIKGKATIAESILVGRPCSCAGFPFPHKRTRACFRRY